jgi:hypothetical protein
MFAPTSSLATVTQRFCLVLALALSAPAGNCTVHAESLPGPAVATVGSQGPCIAWSWTRLFSPVEHLLGNQAAMMRFGIIALVSALYIIWWRK